MSDDAAGGFVTSPESSFIPPTPASTATTLASPPILSTPSRAITSREESRLISALDDQMTTISSRWTRRHQEGGYTSLKRLSKDYHHLLDSLLHHQPPAKPFMVAQYLIRIVGDLNEQLPSLPVPDDPRGIFYVLKQVDDAIVARLAKDNEGMRQTERVRLRSELERGRGIVAMTFEEYKGSYKVEEAIGRVYERSLEEIEEPYGGGGMNLRMESGDFDDDIEDRLQEDDIEEE